MLEVTIPSEIRDYKGKLIAGLTLRQFFGIGGALLIGVPVAVKGNGNISGEILPWLVLGSAAPFLLYGFMKFKGMYFEEFAKVLFEYFFLPQKRVYEDEQDNIFCKIREKMLEEDIRRQRMNRGDFEEDGEEFEE
jgi:hypothetical protein